jgi:hypothetical protein
MNPELDIVGKQLCEGLTAWFMARAFPVLVGVVIGIAVVWLVK